MVLSTRFHILPLKNIRDIYYNREITAEELPTERERYGSTHEGIVRRAQYVFKNYGGPVPTGGSKDVDVEWVTVHADGGADKGVALPMMNPWEGQFALVV